MNLKTYAIVYTVPYSREIQAFDSKDAEAKGRNIAKYNNGRLVSVSFVRDIGGLSLLGDIPQPGTEGGP